MHRQVRFADSATFTKCELFDIIEALVATGYALVHCEDNFHAELLAGIVDDLEYRLARAEDA